MAHHTVKSGYVELVDRLNRFPLGAPPSQLLYKILEMLYSEKEAKLVSECMELLSKAYEHNLVQFGDNVREGVNFICNCCGCCCEAMIAARQFAIFHPVHTTNFIPHIQEATCTGCRKCVTVCPVEAMILVSAKDPHHPKKKKARLHADICLGCGVCARVCPVDCIGLRSLEQRVVTPLNTAHK